MPKWSGQDCFACLHKSRLGWLSNGWNNGKGIALTYIARIRLQRSTCYSGVPFRGYASVKNATEPSSTCKHDVTIDSDVGTVCARFGSIIDCWRSERIMLLRAIDWLKGMRKSWTNVFERIGRIFKILSMQTWPSNDLLQASNSLFFFLDHWLWMDSFFFFFKVRC